MMIPAKELLNRVMWDKKEDGPDYSIGYWGNIRKKIVFIGFDEVKRIEGNFMLLERAKETYIPMHRIREIRKKGKVVWERKREDRQ
ncbi:DUF504 domain-containing protein [Candidatus Woesearchaeota archaeon]|nr:DUF504 domain-containing protein [Candidatus Woesearchaeota archaeon]